MTTKADRAAAERVLNRAVKRAIERLRADGPSPQTTWANEAAFIAACDVAGMLVEDAA